MSDPDEDSTRTKLPPPTDKPMASLYVGDLHADVTEAVLFQKFSTAGPVLSIRVLRDMTTRRSLGYAYVNFQSPEDAQKALDTMNFDVIYGQPIRIMWQERDPALRKSGVGNIFIKNLDSSIDNKALHDTFTKFGNILSCKVTTDRHSIDSTGFAFVHFQTEEAAQSAIYRMNGTMLKDKKLFVGKFLSRQERVTTAQSDQAKNFTNVYIKDVPGGFNDEQLVNLCQSFGKVISAKVIEQAGSSSRLGIVSCEDHKSAEAIKRLVGQSPPSWGDLKPGHPTQEANHHLKMSQLGQQHMQQAAAVSNTDRISGQQLSPEHRAAVPQGSPMQAQEFYAGQQLPYNPMHTGAVPPMVYPNQTLPESYGNHKLSAAPSLPQQQASEQITAARILSQMALAQASKQSCPGYTCTLLAGQGIKQDAHSTGPGIANCHDHNYDQPQRASPSFEDLRQSYLTQERGLGHSSEGLHAQGYPLYPKHGDAMIPNAYPLQPMQFHQKPESTPTARSQSALAQGYHASPQVFWYPTPSGFVPQLVYPDPVSPYQANLESSLGMHPWGRQQVEAPYAHPVADEPALEHNLAEMLRQMALTGPSRFPGSTGTCSATCSSHSHSHACPQAEEGDAMRETCHTHPNDLNTLDNVFAKQEPSRR